MSHTSTLTFAGSYPSIATSKIGSGASNLTYQCLMNEKVSQTVTCELVGPLTNKQLASINDSVVRTDTFRYQLKGKGLLHHLNFPTNSSAHITHVFTLTDSLLRKPMFYRRCIWKGQAEHLGIKG